MTTDTAAIIDVAQQAAGAETLALGEYHIVVTPQGVTHIDLTGDQYRGLPRRKTGTVVVRDAASFLAYWSKHSSEASEVYADRDQVAVVGILDAYGTGGDATNWRQHQVVLKLRHSESFKAWTAISRSLSNQTQFAEFIEEHRSDVITPTAAEVLELAQTFQANTKVTFRSSQLLRSGQRQLQYVETIEASGGQRGEMTIPEALELGLPVFDGATLADRVTARLRYRIEDGRLKLGVVLDQVSEVIDSAFEGVVTEVGAGVGDVPVLRGTPA